MRITDRKTIILSSCFIITFCLFALFAITTSSVRADVFQFKVGEPGYLRALAVAAAEGAAAEVDVGEKIDLDENYQPKDFGIENLGFLPNNPLYVFKSLRRGTVSLFTVDPAEQAELKLQFAAEKLLEAKELSAREGVNESTVVRALENYQDELRKVDKEIREAAGIAEERRQELLNNSLDLMTKSQKVLGTFDKALSPEAFDVIQDVRTNTAETFGAIFTLGAPEAISEGLVDVLDAQSGSEFKHFKNLEVLKEIEDRVPEEAKDAIKNAQGNVLTKLQVQLEQSDEAQQATFADFVKEVGGNEVRHLEVMNELEVLPVSDEVRSALTTAKEEVLAKTEDRLETLTPEQKEKFLAHLAEGSLEKVRVLKEVENNVAAGVLTGVEKVRQQATEQLKQKIETASTDETQKQKFAESIERFHDAKSISVLEEIGALIPEDKKEFFNSLKQKAAEEIKRDINNARNTAQKQVIYNALAGDNPEDVAALNSFEDDIGASLRGVVAGLRSAQYGRVQNRVQNIKDENRLQQFEDEYKKYEDSFKSAPKSVNMNTLLKDKKGIFESPERASQKIAEARVALQKLQEAINTLSLEFAFKDGRLDPALQEIERMRAAGERKLGVAETSLEYNDVGRAYGEAEAALQMARSGLNMTNGYKDGKRKETEMLSFLPKDFYLEPGTAVTRPSVTQGFDIYNAGEFGQLCAFSGGFLKEKTRCEFRDGRVLEVPSGVFPFRVPPEFVPRPIVDPDDQGQVGCPPLPAVVGNFCEGGTIKYQRDARGCSIAPRCEYERTDEEIDENSRRHPTNPMLCGGKENYICPSSAFRCDVKNVEKSGYSKCVLTKEDVTCQAYFEGWQYEKEKNQCVKRNATGCADPFVYKTEEQCKTGQSRDGGYKGDENSCPGFAYSKQDAKGVRYCQLNYEYKCSYNYPEYLERTNYTAEKCPSDLIVDPKICPAMPTVTSCPTGQKMVVSYSSPECGKYYTCTTDTGTKAGWVEHRWKFTDGEQTSMILDRFDKEYLDFIASVDAQCLKISKTKFAWKPGAGTDTNMWEFGIPDCSGTAAPAARCGNKTCETGETAESCAEDCWGPSGSCGQYTSESSCKATADCSWTVAKTYYGGYCASTSTTWTPQCSDKKDNDGDGKVDFPTDSGCYSAMDDLEQDNVNGEQGMRKCFYPNATINGKQPGHNVWCEADYMNCRKGSETGEALSLTGLSLGAPSSCESGWTGGSGGGCGMYTTQSQCTAMSGCMWSNNACSPKDSSGTGTAGTSQCSNGKDDDSDGKTDYPDDTSCWGKEDNDEWYPSSNTSVACGSNTTMTSCLVNPLCNWSGGKCGYNDTRNASKCASGQYWDGSTCVSSSTSCTSSQYWDSASQKCVTSTTSTTSSKPQCSDGVDNDSDGKIDYPADSGCYGADDMSEAYTDTSSGTGSSSSSMKRCFYTGATINGANPGYSVWCESDYYNCHKGDPSGEIVPLSGLSLGAPSSCESGWSSNQTVGSGCRSQTSQSTCSSVSGCYWYSGYSGNYCDSSGSAAPSSSGSVACGSFTSMSACVANSSCNWNTSGNYCTYNNPTSSSGGGCGMYSSMSTCVSMSACKWENSACVYNTTSSSSSSGSWSSCPSGQYWDTRVSACKSNEGACAEAGGTWNSSSNYCQMSGTTSGSSTYSSSCSSTEYWDSSTQSCRPMSSSSSMTCPSDQYWNGSSCVPMSSSSSGGSGSTYTSSCSSTEYWDSATQSCKPMSSSSSGGGSSCPSGQYWNGSTCATGTQ